MKELPYLKFYPSEWLQGDITLCSLSAQGLFANIMAHYWMKDCELPYSVIERRYSNATAELEELLSEGIIKVNDGSNIEICFLDEQRVELTSLHDARAKAGRKGGKATRLQRTSKPKQCLSKSEAGPKHIDKDEEGDKDKDKSLSGFDVFWNAYPKKKGKQQAVTAWKKNKCHDKLTDIIESLKWQTRQKDWIKDDGQFVPYPASWLNGKRWEDEQTAESATKVDMPDRYVERT